MAHNKQGRGIPRSITFVGCLVLIAVGLIIGGVLGSARAGFMLGIVLALGWEIYGSMSRGGPTWRAFLAILTHLCVLTIGRHPVRDRALLEKARMSQMTNVIMDAKRPFALPISANETYRHDGRASASDRLILAALLILWSFVTLALHIYAPNSWFIAFLAALATLALHRAEYLRRIAAANESLSGKADPYIARMRAALTGEGDGNYVDPDARRTAYAAGALALYDLIAPILGFTGIGFVSLILFGIGLWFGMRSANSLAQRAIVRNQAVYELWTDLLGPLSKALGTSPLELQKSNALLVVGHRKVWIRVTPEIARRRRQLDDLFIECGIDGYMIDWASSTPKALLLVEASPARRALHQAYVDSDGLYVGVVPAPLLPGEKPISERPVDMILTLSSTFRRDDIPRLQEHVEERSPETSLHGTIVMLDLASATSTARVMAVSAEELALIKHIADLNGNNPWDYWMVVEQWGDKLSDKSGRFRAQRIRFKDTRRRVAGNTPEVRRAKYWEPLMLAIPEWNTRCFVEDDQTSNDTVLTWRREGKLPDGAIPYPWDIEPTYKRGAVGIDEYGEYVYASVLESNGLAGGVPGSGKSGFLTTFITNNARQPNVALVGLDPKEVEQAPWEPRFSRIATDLDDITTVLTALCDEMDRRYSLVRKLGKKKITADMIGPDLPLIVVVGDEMAEMLAMGVTKDEKGADSERVGKWQRLVQKGRAAGITAFGATQKPGADVIPTRLRDIIQQRFAYATTNPFMTDTILGTGMSSLGPAHEISHNEKGVAYVVREDSRIPVKMKTFWIPDEEVPTIAKKYAHMRVDLPFLDAGAADAFDGKMTDYAASHHDAFSGSAAPEPIEDAIDAEVVTDKEPKPATPKLDPTAFASLFKNFNNKKAS